MSATPDLEFVYVGDPMCSWCWGFAPVLESLQARYDIPIRTVVGGLRPGPSAEPLTARMRRYLIHHWEQVAARSGQPFDQAGLDRDDWVYDTELPARAVVTMREVSPDETLPFFTRLQRAFYAERVDVTDPSAYPPLVEGFPVDAGTFMDRLETDASRDAAWRDFGEARRLGIEGFPALVLRTEDGFVMVTRGFLPYADLEPALTRWLTDAYPTAIEGLVCAVDGDC